MCIQSCFILDTLAIRNGYGLLFVNQNKTMVCKKRVSFEKEKRHKTKDDKRPLAHN